MTVRMWSPRLLLPAVLLLACSTSESAPSTTAPGGGFAVWPEPAGFDAQADASADAADNPWLSGLGAAGATSDPESTARTSTPTSSTASTSESSTGSSSSEPAPADPAQLFFRGYLETTTSQKALLIENPGAVTASDCQVAVYSNGGVEPWRTFALDPIAPRASALVCIPDAFSTACTQTFGGSAFNGDDALVLSCGATIWDVIGIVGEDPGDAWEGSGLDGQTLSTRDLALWRCRAPALVTDIETAAGPVFDTTDWIAVAEEQLLGATGECPALEDAVGGAGGEGG